MSNKSKIPIIKNRFKIPKGYLENFNSKLISEFVPVTNDFLIPDEYFENISSRVIKQKIRSGKIRYLKNVFYRVSSVAAIFVLVFTVYNLFKFNKEINYSDVMNYADKHIIELSTYDFVDLLDSDDLDFSEYVNYSDIENYFIENPSAEIIIYE
ncbi:MAG: hypothetical protein CMC72_03305 [Flavobacteriaceae bacterium]|nr:hypothetical protein [Flavobacteriaceae bacterium]|tara:strand:- start:1503 stop:1964 length:462 start_codon:yes stop_codon:yes gene_type:complete